MNNSSTAVPTSNRPETQSTTLWPSIDPCKTNNQRPYVASILYTFDPFIILSEISLYLVMFTGIVKLAQVDDYISPSQSCIQPKIMKES